MSRSAVRELYDNDFLTRGEYESYISYEAKKDKVVHSKKVKKSIEDGETFYPPLELGVKTLEYILNNGGSSKQALEEAMLAMGKDKEWLNIVKSKRYGLVAETLKSVKDHPERKVMDKNGTWNQTGFKRSPTVNALSQQVSQAKKTSDALESMRIDLKVVKEDSIVTSAKTVDLIEVLGLTESTDKAAIIALYKNGCKTKRIVELTGVSRSTVDRTLKAYRDSLKE
jgi:hypothetical protein